MRKGKLVDFKMFGNVVRLYVSFDEALDRWYGDDWDDVPYEHNAGEVYDEFFDGWVEIAFPSDYIVHEPCAGHMNSGWCKDDMLDGRVPMVAVCRFDWDDWHGRDMASWSFDNMVGNRDTVMFRMGQVVDLDDMPSWVPDGAHVFPFVNTPWEKRD